ncbi:cytoplasmic dynein 2 heavy chain 1 [Helicoverpa zea]|uniref:cytoplasmic dynein 2 heavy chain 1 n=1 Tax=Helicoverpa zea TaxID=7113 RepID=UPI001F56D2DD|nr:cytoplasmic dynein 2 heavy chain 1 [Helicoverpa zea]
MLPLRHFIISTIEHYFSKPELKLDEKSEDALADFINNPNILIIQGRLSNDVIYLHTKIQDGKSNSIVFYKTLAQELLKEDAIHNINILTLSNNTVESLYQIWRQVYTPLLAAGNDLYSNKLQKNLSDLESNLRILAHGKGDTNINVVLSIQDELEYWRTVGQKRDATKKEKEASSNFCELFEDVLEEIRTIHSSSMEEIRESAENIGGILDDIWRISTSLYSQERMVHVFDIIGHEICSIIQNSVSTTDLWKVHNGNKDSEILNLLSESCHVIQTWNSACESLTETYWPNYALHAWNGGPYVPSFCVNFQTRVKEIHDIRSTHNQLNKLLSNNERSELQTNELFAPFENVNIWMCNGPNPGWETAVSKFSTSLRPAESKVAEKLKPRLHNMSTKQMLYEFMRYSSLIERPLVKHALNTELEIFVSSLLSMLKSIQAQMDADEVVVNLYQPPEMSNVVLQIQWAKLMEAKVKEIKMCAEKYLKEFDSSSELHSLATKLLKDLKNMYTQLHEEWCRDLQAQAKNGSLQISTDKPVVEFSSSSRLMVVNFNPGLVRLELEARSLAAMRLPPPPAAAVLDNLSTALAHARPLQQVASFHNTLGERMIPSTRPMMLQAALDLSNLVQDQKAVYWDDVEQLANYTDKLKKIVLKLETQNTYLTGQHVAIRNIVQKLIETELLAKQSEWKKGVKDIRDIIDTVESNGYKNTELWRSHWDWQLYKALEYQYIKTLLSLHKHFPHVKVDLVLRGYAVRVQPAIEEIRVQHYHQLRRLVSMPAHFVGVQNNLTDKQSIFAAIVEKHSWLGNKAVQQLESALSSLEATCASWTRRAALACVPDLDALCREHLTLPQHWENNFKACKAYGQAVAKMTFEDEKIEWISVGTTTLRREFEAQARSLWACLMSSLVASCRSDAARIDAFVASAAVMLENQALPKNAKELAEMSATQQALQQQMPEMEETVEALKRKGHMLRTWGGDTSVDSTMKEWQKIHELMLSQQKMFEHQAELVKSSLSGEWDNLNTSIEAWTSRWTQAKPRLDDTHGVNYTEMLDRCRSVFEAHANWNKFVADRDDLLKECEKFQMKVQLSDTWDQAEKLMTEYVELWSPFKEYNEEFESIADQEWIVFQKKIHLIEEFSVKWKSRLEPFTVLTLYIQQELEKYSDLAPLLKYLRGNEFTERHWREVYSLLDMEYKKPDTLQVRDLLNAAINIKKQIKSLQKICTSASSESAIRNALNELEIWFASARFSITYYNDKAKQPTPIVKDFKDILSKIEEQQWVVSSLSGGANGTDACGAWDARLRAARALLRATHHAQRRWLYLEPILSNDDGELGIKFRKVDQGFRQVTRILEADPRLSALLQSSRLQPMLDSISEQLLACQSALNLYIDEKRSVFPRLYFLSDDDLLELLGQARAGAEGREAVMQTHLKKLFPGITGVRLGPGDMSITALCTHYGETFQLDHPVDIDCPVEIWLKNLEAEMRSSLKSMTLKCIVTNSLQEQDPFSLPTQILCLAQNIRFTEQAEKAITSKELHKLKANIEKENLYYASAEIEDESERRKRQALILQCAHYLSVIRILIDSNIVSTSDWLWQKQLRFYVLNTKEVVAKMGLAQISYSYEYLGVNTGQFVRTELADDCFFILTQSLHLGLVGNPFGPAGTGKTESVKALGGLVGRLVLIFNCDEAMDAECMGRLLSGLALCGAWGCFDEFNRLAAHTLAAVSHQLSSLLSATTDRTAGSEPTAVLNGKHVRVSEWCGVAATMNPAGRGYGGRRKLPAALQRVMRPVAMLQPRPDVLAAHLLAAACVPDAEILAKDLHDVFSLASSLLSEQRHYDWGLRAVKAAVGSCAAALQSRAADLRGRRAAARRVLTLNNLSKLTTYDATRFENILSLVFSDVPTEESSSDPICTTLEATVDNLKLVHNKLQLQKCVELYEQMQQRMGVVIVGPPGSGKTTIRRLLKSALAHQGKNVVEYIICPKAMSREWLLGNIDNDTRQWTDGVISSTALEISNQPSDVWSWVVCDGDIDPEWIEALNSVLDDNRLLTLPSGWRIQFGSNVNFLFETHSLEHASPATVSRMGIILLSDDVSCDLDVLEGWMRSADFDNENAKMALPLLQQVIKKSIQWLTDHKSDLALKLQNVTVVKQILTQFEYVAQDTGFNTTRVSPEELVYLAIERSVVDVIKDSAIDSFHDELSSLMGPPIVAPVCISEWVSDTLLMSRRLVSCEPTLRACVTSHTAHLLLVGPDACAKNLLAEYIIKECNSAVLTIDCTPILEPADIIAELKRNNMVHSGGRGVSGGARGTLLLRSLHRARTDAWKSSPVHSFLLQLIQHNGFWTRGTDEEGGAGTQWCQVSRLRVLATATTHSAISPRLAAALELRVLSESEDEELLEIATHYLKNSVDKSIPMKDITKLAETLLAMFKEVTETFDSEIHYKWNASHLKRWCENIKWYSPTNVDQLVMAISAEANFIFRERLISDDEKAMFSTISRKHLKVNNEAMYFACKLRGDGVYLEQTDYNDWHRRTELLINQCLSENEHNVFGETGAEVCSELATLCPAMARSTNGGLLVCVGCAGVGRLAAAHITAAALPATLFVINDDTQFNTIFKSALSSAGEGKRSVVLVRESAASSAALSAVEALRRARTPHALPAMLMPNAEQNTLKSIKENLGIIICLDKSQDNLSELMDKYPLLYNDGNIVWLDHWSDVTLRETPRLIVQRLLKENAVESTKEQLEALPIDGFVNIHKSIDVEWKRAPCRYVNFVKTYYNISNRKKTALVQRHSMLSAGVEALRRARTDVSRLQAEAATQEVALREKQAAAAHALQQISATVRANTDHKDEMHTLKRNIEIENEKLQAQKKEIEAELAAVEPIIAAARSAVGDIRPESLSEVRSLRAPPEVVRDVLEGVLRLMGIADTSWHSMKNFLSKRGVKEDIRCMDASQISPTALASVQRLLETRGGSFEPATAKRASAACAPLVAWVKANLHYAAALQRVQPLQAHQAKLHKNLTDAEQQMTALSTGLATVEERVAALQEQLGQHTRDAAALELRLTQANETITAATSLIDQLAHEYTAWENDLENISKEISQLNPRSLLSAAYIVYLPDITEPQARAYVTKWSALIGFEDSSFSIINFLSSTEKQLKWEADGLPSDTTAIKNAVLIDQFLESQRCGFTPLIVDPDGEGLAWLKNTLTGTQCDFVSQRSEKFMTTVQYAVRLGRTLVISEATDTPPVAGARVLLRCGSAPALAPHRHAALSPLYFAPTLHALTDQLVHYALQQQNPEVDEKSREIKLKKATLQKQQYELQENLLRDLSNKGDILQDAGVLASLSKTRATNDTLVEALAAAKEVEQASRVACQMYESAAQRTAVLALATNDLATRWPLIALPVDAVLDIFVDAVRRQPDQTKINNSEVIKCVTRKIVERVLLSLHKKDKYVVVLYLLKHVYDDLIPNELWQIFIGNHDLIEDAGNVNEIKSNFPWIPQGCVKKIAKLKVVNEDFYNRLSLQNQEVWKDFLQSGDINILSKFKLSGFETVVAVTVIRPDSVYRAIVAFVDQLLGAGVVAGGALVARVAAGTRRGRRAPRPALLLAAHARDVLAAAAPQLTHVGIEEGRAAWEAALESCRSGNWLAITVGASPFTHDLQAFIAAYLESPAEQYHEEFRLWILSEDREVPPPISNACVNVILEAPEGVKNNVMSTLHAWGAYSGDAATVRLLAALALFHALVQERRAYIPLGWSQWYAWEWGSAAAGARWVRGGGGGRGAAALYAARLCSAADQRVLAALQRRYLADAALSPRWKPVPLTVPLPFTTSLSDYTVAFDALPDIDSPQLLALPANCRVAWEKNAANDIVTRLKELNSTVSVVNKSDNITPLKALLSLWKKLMSGSPFIKADYQIEKAGSGWWWCVRTGEARDAARAARVLHAALARAHLRATPMLRVSDEWHMLWSGPNAVDAYIREFALRARAALTRLDTQLSDNYMPTEVDLRSFLRPSRVVWALRAHTAARLACSVHALTLSVKWNWTEGESTEGGVVVLGLRLCGAVWAGAALQPSHAAQPPHAPAPPLLLRYVLQEGDSTCAWERSAEVPLYADEARAALVLQARAPLAPHYEPDAAALHALALFIAAHD